MKLRLVFNPLFGVLERPTSDPVVEDRQTEISRPHLPRFVPEESGLDGSDQSRWTEGVDGLLRKAEAGREAFVLSPDKANGRQNFRLVLMAEGSFFVPVNNLTSRFKSQVKAQEIGERFLNRDQPTQFVGISEAFNVLQVSSTVERI